MTHTHSTRLGSSDSPPTVLIVEDDPILRFSLATEIGKAGFRVREAASADAAETALETGVPIDVVVTDVEMPGSRDGVALARNVRAVHPHMKVIIASGVAPPAEIVGVADAFFGKPYDTDRVIFRIRALLGGPAAQAAKL
jgi:two-component system, response regulator PdtaR